MSTQDPYDAQTAEVVAKFSKYAHPKDYKYWKGLLEQRDKQGSSFTATLLQHQGINKFVACAVRALHLPSVPVAFRRLSSKDLENEFLSFRATNNYLCTIYAPSGKVSDNKYQQWYVLAKEASGNLSEENIYTLIYEHGRGGGPDSYWFARIPVSALTANDSNYGCQATRLNVFFEPALVSDVVRMLARSGGRPAQFTGTDAEHVEEEEEELEP